MRLAKILLCVGLVLAPAARAGSLRDNAAYLDFQAMGFFDESDLSVNVNLDGSLLRLLASLGSHEDPDAAAVLGKLEAVQVRVLPLGGTERTDALLGKISELSRQMDKSGWDRIVQVRERDERVEVFLQHNDSVVSGLVVLAIQPNDEAVFVNLVGEIDLKQLGSIGRHIDFGSDKHIDLDSLSGIDKEMNRLRELRKKREADEN